MKFMIRINDKYTCFSTKGRTYPLGIIIIASRNTEACNEYVDFMIRMRTSIYDDGKQMVHESIQLDRRVL